MTKKYSTDFLEAVNDDLNLPRALQVVHDMMDDFEFSPLKKAKLLEKFDEVLGLNVKGIKEEKLKIPREILELVDEREKLRKAKLWVEADLLRERIRERGFEIEDTSKGPVLTLA